MGKKTSKKRLNTLPIKQFQPDKPKQVNIVPRNVTQESYLLKLLDPSKDIVFGVGPAGTGKTLIAVQVAIKMFKEKKVNLKQINKLMKNQTRVNDKIQERKRERWLKKVKDTFKTSPLSVDRTKKPKRDLRIIH